MPGFFVSCTYASKSRHKGGTFTSSQMEGAARMPANANPASRVDCSVARVLLEHFPDRCRPGRAVLNRHADATNP